MQLEDNIKLNFRYTNSKHKPIIQESSIHLFSNSQHL